MGFGDRETNGLRLGLCLHSFEKDTSLLTYQSTILWKTALINSRQYFSTLMKTRETEAFLSYLVFRHLVESLMEIFVG